MEPITQAVYANTTLPLDICKLIQDSVSGTSNDWKAKYNEMVAKMKEGYAETRPELLNFAPVERRICAAQGHKIECYCWVRRTHVQSWKHVPMLLEYKILRFWKNEFWKEKQTRFTHKKQRIQ